MLELTQTRRYAWADEDTNLAWTLAVVTGSSVEAVVLAYGGDPTEQAAVVPFLDAKVPHDELGTYSLLQVRHLGPNVVAIENNGWRGKAGDVAERASKDGRFVSVFWNLNGNYKVTVAEGGTLTASFDPLTVQHPAPIGESYPSWITDVVFSDDNVHAVLLAIVESQTGVVIDPAWLTDAAPTYRVPA